MALQNTTNSHPSFVDTIAAKTSDAWLLIGRIMMGFIFLRSGFGKIFDIPAYSETFPRRGLHPLLAYIAVPAEFFGGIALIFGFATRYVVIVLLIFMVVATFSSHRYWDFTDAAQRRVQDSAFWKNVAMTGGLFFLFVCGAGRWSVDYVLRRKS